MCALPVVLLLAACATPGPPSPPPLRPEGRSSVDVFLRHRAELDLTDDQVRRLETLDARCERESADARAELEAMRGAARTRKPAGGARADGPAGAPGIGGPAGMGGAGGRHGGETPRAPTSGPTDAERRHLLLQRIDGADTRAWFEARDTVLTAAQGPLAERLATAWRVEVIDYREAMKHRPRDEAN